MTTRSYDNSTREQAARLTRARILQAAYDLLVSRGYPALTVAALAQRAGVSPQTIYNAVGGKARVLKACYDVTLAGDDEPMPMSTRPQIAVMSEAADVEQFLSAYGAWCRHIYGRIAPVVGSLAASGAADKGVADFLATTERERRIGTTRVIESFAGRFGLPRGMAHPQAVDGVWTLNAPEVYDRLVRRCGWSSADYEVWLTRQLVAFLT